MSDAAEKKKDDHAADHGEKKKGGGIGALLGKLPVMIGGVMVLEAAFLIVGLKVLGAGANNASAQIEIPKAEAHGDEAEGHGDAHGEPADAHGEAKKDDGHGDAGGHGEAKEGDAKATPIDPKKSYELVVVEFRAPNKRSGRTFLYDLSIYASVRGKNKAAVEAAIKDRGALIKDRVRTIIAQSDPEKLGGGTEPGLETLRRQVKVQLDDILGDGRVEEVLVARCIPFRTDF